MFVLDQCKFPREITLINAPINGILHMALKKRHCQESNMQSSLRNNGALSINALGQFPRSCDR